jgi:hypothetical protein
MLYKAQSSPKNEWLRHSLKKGITMKRYFVASLLVMFLLTACATPPPRRNYSRRRQQAPAPCNQHVYPIRNAAIVVGVTINATYTAKDINGARSYTEPDVINRLNENSRNNGDGNSFSQQNGNQKNLTFNYTINNDSYGHYTGSLDMSGWGVGQIHTFSTSNPYSDPTQMFRDLTDQAYSFIHGGWKDTRPECP